MNFSKRSSCRPRYSNRYIPPYERLLRRNQSWKPKKVQQEEELKEECRRGSLALFKQPEEYSCYFIHKNTSLVIVDRLINEARRTIHYSMDTEGDALSHKPATLQVEFIQPGAPSIVIILEAQYLPEAATLLFGKIQELMTIIFTSNSNIYSWGSAFEEIEKFKAFNIIKGSLKFVEYDIQQDFSGAQKQSLQKTIKNVFKEYLNKTATLAEWGCGIDLHLGTYIPEYVVGPDRTNQMREEKYYREELKTYALNDVFAVTKLCYYLNLIKLAPANEYEDISEDEEQINQEDAISINLSPTYERIIINAVVEPDTNYNDINRWRLPEIMIPHFDEEPRHEEPQQRPQHTNEQSSDEQMTVYETNEENQVRHSNLEETTAATANADAKRRRNRRTNIQHRRKRYRYQVTRHVYHRFNITKIKRVLRSMDISYINIVLFNHRLLMGLKTRRIADEVEQLLNDRIFTERHYYRLYPY